MDSPNLSETLLSPALLRPTVRISYGLPFPQACLSHINSTFHSSRIYIISSASLAQHTRHLADLQSALGDRVVGTRIGLKPHTLWSEILEVVQEARDLRADLLITLGAGSLTDGAKIIALALANNVHTSSSLASLSSSAPPHTHPTIINAPTIPIISIPTTLSGGEYSASAGGTDDRTRRKHNFSSPIQGPALVILDADLARTTPPRVWLSTGIRAVDHCVESICSLESTPRADASAAASLELLVPGLLRCKRDGEDVRARHRCQMGVVEAMKAAAQGVSPGASHAIGHQLGPLGVGHGETSCVLLPAVCRYNAKYGANNDRQRKVLGLLWKAPDVRDVLVRRGLAADRADLGDALDAVIRELGLPRSLADVGVGRDKLDGIADNSLLDRWCITNPVPLTQKAQVLEILEMVVG